jgi:formylglycine-generating enzyme required for sulfatase activity
MPAPATSLPTIEQLDDFLCALRLADFKIGPDQMAGAQKILLLALAEANGGSTAARLKTMLAPIVVRTPTQQADFYRRFEALMAEIGPAPAVTRVESGEGGLRDAGAAPTARPALSRRLIAMAGAAGALFAITIGLRSDSVPPAPLSTPPIAAKGFAIPTVTAEVKPVKFVAATLFRRSGYQAAHAGLIALPLLLFAGWMVWRWRRRVLWLARHPGVRDADPAGVRLPAPDQPLFSAAALSAIALDLRRHLRVSSRDLDIDRTIPETLDAGGSFTPAWRTVPRSPSYLFLIERESAHDHVAGILDRAVDRLMGELVAVERYYFRGDPRWLLAAKGGRGVEPIADVAARHGDHRLVVLAGGDGLFAPLTDRLEPGVEQALAQWVPRAMLSTKPMRSWSRRELALVFEAGFDLATASRSGLAALARRSAAEPDRTAELLEGVVALTPTQSSLPRPRAQPTPSHGRRSALVINADAYQHSAARMDHLGQLLRKPASGFTVRAVRNPDRRTLIDALELLVRRNSSPDDTILIHCFGRIFYRDERSPELYLAIRDGPVSWRDVAAVLNRSNAGHQVLIIDGLRELYGNDSSEVTKSLDLDNGLSPPGQRREIVWALAAADPNRETWLAGGLTGLLIQTIVEDRARAQPGPITLRLLFELAVERASHLGIFDGLSPIYFARGVNGEGASAIITFRPQYLDPKAEPAAERLPRSVFRDLEAPWCPELVVTPAGRLTMGPAAAEEGRDNSEGQERMVAVAAFAMGRTPVTFDEWDACVADGGGSGYMPEDKGWGRGRRPVIHVSWADAQAYLSWLSRKTGRPYRLPSGAEWEYAARGGTQTAYPWGGDWDPRFANGALSVGRTTEVGSYPANPIGLYDMIGNVWEWVEDRWHENYYSGAAVDGSARTESSDGDLREMRGGSWSGAPGVLHVAFRNWVEPLVRLNNLGFRVCRTLTPGDLTALRPGGSGGVDPVAPP